MPRAKATAHRLSSAPLSGVSSESGPTPSVMTRSTRSKPRSATVAFVTNRAVEHARRTTRASPSSDVAASSANVPHGSSPSSIAEPYPSNQLPRSPSTNAAPTTDHEQQQGSVSNPQPSQSNTQYNPSNLDHSMSSAEPVLDVRQTRSSPANNTPPSTTRQLRRSSNRASDGASNASRRASNNLALRSNRAISKPTTNLSSRRVSRKSPGDVDEVILDASDASVVNASLVEATSSLGPSTKYHSSSAIRPSATPQSATPRASVTLRSSSNPRPSISPGSDPPPNASSSLRLSTRSSRATNAQPSPDNEEPSSEPKNCLQCKNALNPNKMAQCGACARFCHVYCMRPKKVSVPRGEWVCARCHDTALKYELHLRDLVALHKNKSCVECHKRSLGDANAKSPVATCSTCGLFVHHTCARRFYRNRKAELDEPSWTCRTCKQFSSGKRKLENIGSKSSSPSKRSKSVSPSGPSPTPAMSSRGATASKTPVRPTPSRAGSSRASSSRGSRNATEQGPSPGVSTRRTNSSPSKQGSQSPSTPRATQSRSTANRTDVSDPMKTRKSSSKNPAKGGSSQDSRVEGMPTSGKSTRALTTRRGSNGRFSSSKAVASSSKKQARKTAAPRKPISKPETNRSGRGVQTKVSPTKLSSAIQKASEVSLELPSESHASIENENVSEGVNDGKSNENLDIDIAATNQMDSSHESEEDKEISLNENVEGDVKDELGSTNQETPDVVQQLSESSVIFVDQECIRDGEEVESKSSEPVVERNTAYEENRFENAATDAMPVSNLGVKTIKDVDALRKVKGSEKFFFDEPVNKPANFQNAGPASVTPIIDETVKGTHVDDTAPANEKSVEKDNEAIEQSICDNYERESLNDKESLEKPESPFSEAVQDNLNMDETSQGPGQDMINDTLNDVDARPSTHHNINDAQNDHFVANIIREVVESVSRPGSSEAEDKLDKNVGKAGVDEGGHSTEEVVKEGTQELNDMGHDDEENEFTFAAAPEMFPGRSYEMLVPKEEYSNEMVVVSIDDEVKVVEDRKGERETNFTIDDEVVDLTGNDDEEVSALTSTRLGPSNDAARNNESGALLLEDQAKETHDYKLSFFNQSHSRQEASRTVSGSSVEVDNFASEVDMKEASQSAIAIGDTNTESRNEGERDANVGNEHDQGLYGVVSIENDSRVDGLRGPVHTLATGSNGEGVMRGDGESSVARNRSSDNEQSGEFAVKTDPSNAVLKEADVVMSDSDVDDKGEASASAERPVSISSNGDRAVQGAPNSWVIGTEVNDESGDIDMAQPVQKDENRSPPGMEGSSSLLPEDDTVKPSLKVEAHIEKSQPASYSGVGDAGLQVEEQDEEQEVSFTFENTEPNLFVHAVHYSDEGPESVERASEFPVRTEEEVGGANGLEKQSPKHGEGNVESGNVTPHNMDVEIETEDRVGESENIATNDLSTGSDHNEEHCARSESAEMDLDTHQVDKNSENMDKQSEVIDVDVPTQSNPIMMRDEVNAVEVEVAEVPSDESAIRILDETDVVDVVVDELKTLPVTENTDAEGTVEVYSPNVETGDSVHPDIRENVLNQQALDVDGVRREKGGSDQAEPLVMIEVESDLLVEPLDDKASHGLVSNVDSELIHSESKRRTSESRIVEEVSRVDSVEEPTNINQGSGFSNDHNSVGQKVHHEKKEKVELRTMDDVANTGNVHGENFHKDPEMRSAPFQESAQGDSDLGATDPAQNNKLAGTVNVVNDDVKETLKKADAIKQVDEGCGEISVHERQIKEPSGENDGEAMEVDTNVLADIVGSTDEQNLKKTSTDSAERVNR